MILKKIRRLLAASLLITMVGSSVFYAKADTISELKQKQKEDEAKLNEVTEQIDSMQDQQDLLEEEIADLDAELINMMTSIDVLESQIEESKANITVKQGEIKEAEGEYEEALRIEKEQYEAMKERIRFMYETGDSTYVDLLLASKDISDMLNKADYIEDIYEYDRQQLEAFRQQKELIAQLKANLETEEAELQEQEAQLEQEMADLEAQKGQLDILLADKKARSSNFDVEIAQAKQQAAAYSARIKEEAAKIKKLEAEAEAAKKRQQAASGNYTVTAFDTSVINNANGSELGKKIALYGCQYIGNPYVLGGTSLTNGADCSGFIYRIYSDFGYSLPRTSYQMRTAGTGVDYASAQPGDIICYEGHVALYLGGGYIVHASSVKTGIKISKATYRSILTVRRIVN
ncbi:MAG: C40 family peptidase [Lachnospiraceae bacterium]|nr:C40 family peptidase [Lachnospiraceae bacterium]